MLSGCIRNEDETTSPFMHLSFRLSLAGLHSQSPPNSLLFLWLCSIRSTKSNPNLSALTGKWFRPRSLFSCLTWVERFSVQGSGLKQLNWLSAKEKQVDRHKCYVSHNGWKKLIWITPQSPWIKLRISINYNLWTLNSEPLTSGYLEKLLNSGAFRSGSDMLISWF